MTPSPWRRSLAQALTLVGLALGLGTFCVAATTTISDTPLINLSTVAKPNVMLILDDSGSMSNAYMPDDMGGTSGPGYTSAQCNGLAYNPNNTYSPPKTPTGDYFPAMSYSAVWNDGYSPSLSSATTSTSSLSLGTGVMTITVATVTAGLRVNAPIVIQYKDSVDANNVFSWMSGTITGVSGKVLTVNITFATNSGTYSNWNVGVPSTSALSSSTASYYTYTGGEQAMNWTYDSNTLLSTTFSDECTSSTGGGMFSKVSVLSSSSEAANYANWYAYYRTRMQMTKTVLSQAFADLDATLRVGFTVISDKTITPSKTFLDSNTFDATQKNTLFTDLYRANPNSSTPLRAALSKTGRYFAKKISGQSYDPMQYSCQRNYAVLATDGYWNTGLESSAYGPYKLDGSTTVGQQDGAESTPMWDGGGTTTVTTTTRTQISQTTGNYTHTVSLGNRTSYSACSVLILPGYAQVTTPGAGTRVDTIKTTFQTTVTTVSKSSVVAGTGGQAISTTPTVTQTTVITPISSVTTSTGAVTWHSTGGSSTGGCVLFGSNQGTSYAETSSTDTPIGSPGTTNISDKTVGPTTGTPAVNPGSSDSLADIAEYYYTTDLRTPALGNCTGSAGVDVCGNEVPALGRDSASTQHMTTFTIGLGVNGTLAYDPNYLSQTSGDYINLKNNTVQWPLPGPNAAATNIDDLWHAAVNGRGQYFSASSPDILASSLTTIFSAINAQPGGGSAATASSLTPASGTDKVFQATYKTGEWSGDVSANTVTVGSDGSTLTLTADWFISDRFDQLTATQAGARSIYYMKTSTSGGNTSSSLRSFTYSNLSTDGLGTAFTNFCTQTVAPSQCGGLSTSQKSLANTGSTLVNFLRGDPSYEVKRGNLNPLYRYRAHALGDVVGAAPTYVGSSQFSYSDIGFSAYKASTATRKPVLYVGSNDGMLHAFSADASDKGTELWAFVPTQVMSNLYRLADTAYTNTHRFYVNASPVVADIQVNGTWKTILVGGLGAGGRGFYALDITTPTAPVALWEFTPTNMGLSLGEPIVTKRADGTWVVAMSSGYNNGGDGNGHFYLVNALTGALLLDIPTNTATNVPAGTVSSPNNLAKLNAWVEDPSNNTALRFYGADQLGYVWRFDTDNLVAPKQAALPLAKLQTAGGVAQPVSVRPELAAVQYGTQAYPVVFVATGRYLGSPDLTDTTQQSVYAIKDPMTSTGWGTLRGNANLVQKTPTLNAATGMVSVTGNTVNWSTNIGWFMDLPTSGERVFADMSLQNDAISLVSGVPVVNAQCTASGKSWLYVFSLSDGNVLVSESLSGYMAMGITTLGTGGDSTNVIAGSDGSLRLKDGPSAPPGGQSLRRTSWRELY